MLKDFECIKYNEPMKNHTTFRGGGFADILAQPKSTKELTALIEAARSENIPVTIIGNGSNLLVTDKGIRGLVIKIAKEFSDISVDGDVITAQSGALLSRIASIAYENSLSGFEFASGIPGTIGGAVYMNAGAYGGEIKDVLESCEYLENGEIKIARIDELELSYRRSKFSEKGGIITGVSLRLKKSDKSEILAKMQDYKTRRVTKQPLEYASAGSTFKRPAGYFAGALIEGAGLKGLSVGDAEVSKKHAGFIINKGNATAGDIIELIELVRKKVYESSGVMLEPEVKIIGEK